MDEIGGGGWMIQTFLLDHPRMPSTSFLLMNPKTQLSSRKFWTVGLASLDELGFEARE